MDEKDPFDLDDLDLPGESTPPVVAIAPANSSETPTPTAPAAGHADPVAPEAALVAVEPTSGYDQTWNAPMSISSAYGDVMATQETSVAPQAQAKDADRLLNDEARQMLMDQAERAKAASRQAAKAGAAAAVAAGRTTASAVRRIFADPKTRNWIIGGIAGAVFIAGAVSVGIRLSRDEPKPVVTLPVPVAVQAPAASEAPAQVEAAPLPEVQVEPAPQPCAYRRLGQSSSDNAGCAPAVQEDPVEALPTTQQAVATPVIRQPSPDPAPVKREVKSEPLVDVPRANRRQQPRATPTQTPEETIGERERKQLEAISKFGNALDER